MLRKFTYFLFTFFFFCNTLVFAKQWTIKNVPNPKKINNSFVSNPDRILLPKTVKKINKLLQEVEDKTTAQVAVVLLESIGDEVPKTFANELFNKWGVGQKGTDNGLLVLFVLDQRRIEFETGYGLEPILPDALCYEVQQEQMVPYFKEKKYATGMLKGMEKIAEILIAQDTVRSDNSSYNNQLESYGNEEKPSVSESTETTQYHRDTSYWPKYIAFAIMVSLLYLLFLGIANLRADYYDKYNMLKPFSLHVWWVILPIPFGFFYFLTKYYLNKWRNAPRNSSETGLPMHKLREDEDDLYLQSGQITEENIASVDYDVWVSGAPNDVLILSYGPYFSKYSKCPKCNYRTYFQVYDKVLVAATYVSSGVGERMHECKHCHHAAISKYTIPRKVRHRHRSSGGRSSFGGGGHSRSGGSFGGGRSGGGGAGSSW